MKTPLFELVPETDEMREIRGRIRAFLANDPSVKTPGPDGWNRFDSAFSKRLGAAGWLGMTWPREFGGGGRIDATVAEEERDARRDLTHATITSAFFGDPLPGRSALDRKRAGIPDDPPPLDHRTAYYANMPKITLAGETPR